MGTKLLLADDSITIQKVVGIIFSNEDYDLTVVDNGTLAIEKAREIIPEIMLVDALMPGRNGYEVCQEVRADASLSNMPLLLMTGAFEPFDENKARQCGADDFISKPFESQQLVEKVKALLEVGKQRSALATPRVEAAPPVQPQEQLIVPPLAGSPWDEPAREIEAPFSPTNDIFDDNLAAATKPLVFEPSAAAFVEPEAAGVEVIEAAPGDDPWGVFDLVDLEEPHAAVPDGAADFCGMEMEEPQTIDPYAEEVYSAEIKESEPLIQTVAADKFEAKWEPLEEEIFNYQKDEPTPPGETFAVGMGEPLALLANEPEQFSDMGVAETAILRGEAPVPESDAEVLVGEPPQQHAVAVGEDQLRAVLSQISRDVIEKIVWEVVPDLAENLIREEIRKLKQGMVT